VVSTRIDIELGRTLTFQCHQMSAL
jgi:hypothetical protein